MPAKHTVKQYLAGGYYHLFNRGVEKRKIFQDGQDYRVFLSYLKTYLQPENRFFLQQQLANPKLNWNQKRKLLNILNLKNFAQEIQLLAYCLMPNHFHLLVKQKSATAIESFMQSLSTRYALYFNRKNKRIGPLFQGIYKAVLVTSDEQLFHLSRYIHLNPRQLSPRLNLILCYSSYKDYLGKTKTAWVYLKQILSHFSKSNPLLTYKAFVEEQAKKPNRSILEGLTLE